MKKLIRSPIFWGIIITPFVMYLAFWSGPDFHGNYVAARWLLPFACLAMILGRPIADTTVLFALFQFGVYGWIVSGPRWKIAGAVLLVNTFTVCGDGLRASLITGSADVGMPIPYSRTEE